MDNTNVLESQHIPKAFLIAVIWAVFSLLGLIAILMLPYLGLYGWWLEIIRVISVVFWLPAIGMAELLKLGSLDETILSFDVFLVTVFITPLLWTFPLTAVMDLFSKK